MRISTETFQLQWLNSFKQRQRELADIQQQVSTGRRIQTAADDPSGAAQLIQLQNGLEQLDSYAANADTSRRRLSLAETALNEATDLINRVRELAVQAGGAAQTPETRAALANEAREIYQSLLDVANSQDGEGRYLFAGNRVRDLPFTESGGTVSYNGDDGVRVQRIGDNRLVAESTPGSEVFAAVRNGNGTFQVIADPANTGTAFYSAATVSDASAWPVGGVTIDFIAADSYQVIDAGGAVIQSGSFSPGDTISAAGASVTIEGTPAAGDQFSVASSQNQDVFTTVQRFVTAMEAGLNGDTARAQAQNLLNSSLLDLDRALGQLDQVRSSVGSRLAVIDQQLENNADLALQYTETLSRVRDVDYAKAISELETQLMGLEAAQRSFAKTRSLSLFNLI